MTSFPRHSCFYKLIGTLIVITILSSLAIIASKRCHLAAVPEHQYKDLKTDRDIAEYISKYYIKLHVLHSIALICGSVIIAFGFIDLVPHNDEDMKFAFHFISVFVIIIIGFVTLYGSYIAYEKPCTSTTNSTCCSVIPAPQIFSNSDRPVVSAVSQKDSQMIAVIGLDASAALLLLITSIVYFIDTRKEAKRSGYLSKVHNSRYLTRY